MSKLCIFAGNANPELSQVVAKLCNLTLGNAEVGRFSDGEVNVQINENVRGKDVFILQSTSAPTNDNLMELMVMADAIHRSSASRITAVIPYFGYARQDRRVRSARVPITAKLCADILTTSGIDRVVTVDLHADQIQGFFDIPVDNVYATPILLKDIETKYGNDDVMVVSPDVGGVVRARALAKLMNDTDLAIIDKRRPEANVAEVMHIIGDVRDRTCIIVDDMVDTAGTLCKAAEAVKNNGAKKVIAYCTHPVLSGAAIKNISGSQLDELVVTDSIALTEPAKAEPKIRQLSLAAMLSETIRRINNEESISAMFERSLNF